MHVIHLTVNDLSRFDVRKKIDTMLTNEIQLIEKHPKNDKRFKLHTKWILKWMIYNQDNKGWSMIFKLTQYISFKELEVHTSDRYIVL